MHLNLKPSLNIHRTDFTLSVFFVRLFLYLVLATLELYLSIHHPGTILLVLFFSVTACMAMVPWYHRTLLSALSSSQQSVASLLSSCFPGPGPEPELATNTLIPTSIALVGIRGPERAIYLDI